MTIFDSNGFERRKESAASGLLNFASIEAFDRGRAAHKIADNSETTAGNDPPAVTPRPNDSPAVTKLKSGVLKLTDVVADAATDQSVKQAAQGARREYVADFVAACSAWFAADMAIARISKMTKSLPVALLATALVGATMKYGTKEVLEHAFVPEKNRTAGPADLAWGVFDASMGVATSHVLSPMAKYFAYGGKAIGSEVGASAAETSFIREFASLTGARTLGYGAWRAPYSVQNHWHELGTAHGMKVVAREIATTASFGFAFGAARAAAPAFTLPW